MMPVLLTGIVLLGLGLLVFWIEPLAASSVLERITPNVIYRLRTDRPHVALSFDDGPHPSFTLQVLEILEQHGAKATFLLIGERALRHPELVSRIKGAGHKVGNHYFMNGSTLSHSDADFIQNLERTERAIGIPTGLKLFRPVAWPGRSSSDLPELTGTSASSAARVLTTTSTFLCGTSDG